MFRPIAKACPLLTIYGNHDNVELIGALRNTDGSPCWLQDGAKRAYGGLVIAGISGNIAMTKRKPHHKTVEDVEAVISKYSRIGTLDILITHEVPEHPLLSRNDRILGHKTFNKAIGKLKPELYLCGHVHIPSVIVRLDVTTLLCLDSSTRHAEYAVVEYKDGKFTDPEIRKMSE
jgi:Icc-related predicted phosphoesterase